MSSSSSLYTPQNALVLGGISFGPDDLPPDLSFVGQRLVAVRQFPGGNVSAQDLGPYDSEISFSGTLRYNNALQRAIAIDQLRLKGNPVELHTLGGIARQVVITEFTFTPSNPHRVNYKITLQPTDVPGTYLSTITSKTTNGTKISISTGSKNYMSRAGRSGGSVTQVGAASVSRTSYQKYVVVRGDSLWKIAAQKLGDGTRWQDIYNLNHLTSTTIVPGQVLLLPTT